MRTALLTVQHRPNNNKYRYMFSGADFETRSGPKIPAADQLEGEASFGFWDAYFWHSWHFEFNFNFVRTSNRFNFVRTAKISTSLEQPKYGCSNEVLFLAFLALKMAFKVNFDPTIGFLVSNMSSMPSFRSFGGLIWP